MSRPIPQVRSELHTVAQAIADGDLDRQAAADQVRALANELHRQRPARKTEPKSQKMTPELAERIRLYAAARPHMSLQQIAVAFNVNAGRVSEAINGKW